MNLICMNLFFIERKRISNSHANSFQFIIFMTCQWTVVDETDSSFLSLFSLFHSLVLVRVGRSEIGAQKPIDSRQWKKWKEAKMNETNRIHDMWFMKIDCQRRCHRRAKIDRDDKLKRNSTIFAGRPLFRSIFNWIWFGWIRWRKVDRISFIE